MPVGGATSDLAGEQDPERGDLDPARSVSPRNGTARIATQMNRVFWMNAAVGAVAIGRPVKNSTNGMLPPMTATANSPARWAPVEEAAPREPHRGPARKPTRMMAATPFLAVV